MAAKAAESTAELSDLQGRLVESEARRAELEDHVKKVQLQMAVVQAEYTNYRNVIGFTQWAEYFSKPDYRWDFA